MSLQTPVAGTSTLMMTIAGLLKAKSGTIPVDGKPLRNEASQVREQGTTILTLPSRIDQQKGASRSRV
ncbi:MAG: hypothetical protein P4L36_05200 [Holophaga sp.]|nr:hypothetical protein [Holophaga sp.]